MGAELGRISGPLLSANLLRNGYDLAFENTLLYLNVNTGRIGINADNPSKELFVNDTINTTNLIVDTQYTVPNFIVGTDTIQQLTGTLYIRPAQSNPVISAVALGTSKLKFDNNALTSVDSINFTPTGTGLAKISNIRSDVVVNGNLHATGSIRWDGGTLQLGNTRSDNVVFSADVNSSIIPNNPGGLEQYNFGSPDDRWANVYADVFHASSIDSTTINASNLFAGNIKITSNTITNTVTGQPIEVIPNGSGVANFNGNNYIYENEIRNTTDGAISFTNTGPGYYKFTGSNGLVIPSGPTVGTEGAELGMIRFNTDLGYVRVFNGTAWISAMGSSSVLNRDEVTDVMDIWTLILG